MDTFWQWLFDNLPLKLMAMVLKENGNGC